MQKINFLSLTPLHFALLLKWLKASHVKPWWDPHINWTFKKIQEKYGEYVKGYKIEDKIPKRLDAYIICLNNKPIGYIQIYNAYDFQRSKPLTNLPANLGAFDMFIGEEKYLGQGIGAKALEQLAAEFAESYAYLFADPDRNNIAAIRSYEKAGFKKIQEHLDVNEVWMIKELNPLESRNYEPTK